MRWHAGRKKDTHKVKHDSFGFVLSNYFFSKLFLNPGRSVVFLPAFAAASIAMGSSYSFANGLSRWLAR